jgi:isoquinoline 1-oxidoreductase subunit beta
MTVSANPKEITAAISRRDLIKGALVVGFALKGVGKAWAGTADSGSVGFSPNGFIRIGQDGRIILVMPSTEMGQGIYTGEAMLIAEELEIGFDQLEVFASMMQ